MLDAVRWDGSNVAEIEAFVGRSPAVADELLTIEDPRTGEGVRVPIGAWLVRVDGDVRVLAARADADPELGRAGSPTRPADIAAERIEAVTETLAFESGYD
jgi:hypothetical protein